MRRKTLPILLLINVKVRQINLAINKMDVIFAKFYPLRVENTGARPSYDGLIFLANGKTESHCIYRRLQFLLRFEEKPLAEILLVGFCKVV